MTFFSHRPLESVDILAVVSAPLPSSHVVYAVFFLNSATKNNFNLVSPLEGVTRGGPPPLQWRHWKNCDRMQEHLSEQ